MKKINLKISPYHFEEIVKNGHSLDHMFLLLIINNGDDISEYCRNNAKINIIKLSLIRKGLITNDCKITDPGKDLLEFLNTRGKKTLLIKREGSTEFEKWWKTFPGTDTFTYKNSSFVGHRSLRINKDDCQRKFNEILLEGEYTASQLIKSLEIDILQKKEASVKQKNNKLSFMQNSLTYLNQRSFEPYIELINTTITITETVGKTIDI